MKIDRFEATVISIIVLFAVCAALTAAFQTPIFMAAISAGTAITVVIAGIRDHFASKR